MVDRQIPEWISEYLPKELIESTLFRFNIELQTVQSFICEDCGAKYPRKVDRCNATNDDGEFCGSASIIRKYQKASVDIVPDLDLDYDTLEEQMQDLPSQYAYYAMIYSEARLRVSLEERKLKAVRGSIVHKIQREAAQDNVKLTGEQVKNVVEADESIVAADKRLQLAQMQCGKMFHMLEALKMKSELARSLAGFKRQEHDRSQQ